jgi:hypothetical protein
MHRSGTSALARVVNLLGVDLNPTLMMSRPNDNETGFWESEEVMRLHDDLLSAFGASWDDTVQLPDGWWLRHEAVPIRERLLALVRRDFSHTRLWAIKDPRLCRLLPLWLDVLKELRCRPVCIMIGRNPVEVVESLRRRSDVPAGFGYPIWLDYVLAGEIHSRVIDRAFLEYDELLHDWRATMKRVAEAIRIEWPRSLDEASAEIEHFLSDDLRHIRVDDASLKADEDLSPMIHRTHQALLRAKSEGADQTLRNEFDEIRNELLDDQRLYGRALASYRSQQRTLQAKIATLEGDQRELDLQLRLRENELKEKSRERHDLQLSQIQELERRDEEIERANEIFVAAQAVKDDELAEANRTFSATLMRKDEQIAAIDELFNVRSQELERLREEFAYQQAEVKAARAETERTRTRMRELEASKKS